MVNRSAALAGLIIRNIVRAVIEINLVDCGIKVIDSNGGRRNLCRSLRLVADLKGDSAGSCHGLTAGHTHSNLSIALRGNAGFPSISKRIRGRLNLNITILDDNLFWVDTECNVGALCNGIGNFRPIAGGLDGQAVDGVRILRRGRGCLTALARIRRPCRHDDEAQDQCQSQ